MYYGFRRLLLLFVLCIFSCDYIKFGRCLEIVEIASTVWVVPTTYIWLGLGNLFETPIKSELSQSENWPLSRLCLGWKSKAQLKDKERSCCNPAEERRRRGRIRCALQQPSQLT